MRNLKFAALALLIASSYPTFANGQFDAVCSYAPSQSKAVAQITSAAGGAALGVKSIMTALGMSSVAHSSGSYILTGAGGYVSGTLGSAIVVPTVMTIGVVVAGAVTTLEVTCAPRNHPDTVAKVNSMMRSLEQSLSSLPKSDSKLLYKTALDQLKKSNQEAIAVRDNVVENVKNMNSVAIDYRDAAFGYFIK